MNLEIRIDGVQVVNALVDSSALTRIFGTVLASPPRATISLQTAEVEPKSSPLTVRQAREVVERIDARSKKFLRALASNAGSLTWREMRELLEIEEDDWAIFSRGAGKGITRVVRHVSRDPNAKLLWWDDDTWNDDDGDDPVNTVHVDGPALVALRTVFELVR